MEPATFRRPSYRWLGGLAIGLSVLEIARAAVFAFAGSFLKDISAMASDPKAAPVEGDPAANFGALGSVLQWSIVPMVVFGVLQIGVGVLVLRGHPRGFRLLGLVATLAAIGGMVAGLMPVIIAQGVVAGLAFRQWGYPTDSESADRSSS